jgi:hypothetical protein
MGEYQPGRKAEGDPPGSTGTKNQSTGGAGVAGEAKSAEERAAEKFLADLIARGEAVEVDGRGKSERDERKPLPPGATHEVVPGKDGEPPVVHRRRYSAF